MPDTPSNPNNKLSISGSSTSSSKKRSRRRRRRNRAHSDTSDNDVSKFPKVENDLNMSSNSPDSNSVMHMTLSNPAQHSTPSKLQFNNNNVIATTHTISMATISYPDGGLYEGSVKTICIPTNSNNCEDKNKVTFQKRQIREGHGVYIDPNHNRYEGLWRNDCAEGHGVKDFVTGDRHEGAYIANTRNGWGKYIFSNGNQYTGEFLNGSMHGKGTFLWSNKGEMYHGEWIKGHMHGYGTKQMENGDCYEGQFQYGKANGWGKKKFSSCNDIHEGLYVSDKRCGFGSYTWSNGDRYEGEWKDGKMNGRGKKIMSNGDSYQGEYMDDKTHGYGVKLFACGDMHEGLYMNDKRHMYGKYIWQNGDIYHGYFINGRICGLGVKRMANGDVYDGEFDADKAHGFGIKTFANGDVHKGQYKYDKRESMGTYIFSNGEKYCGQWKNGAQSGIGTYYYLDNNTFQGRWENGKKNGPGYSFVGSHLVESEHIFLEIWSNDRLAHREDMKAFQQSNLPSIEELCFQQQTKQTLLTHRRKIREVSAKSDQQREAHIAQKPSNLLQNSHSSKMSDETSFCMDVVDRWRWVWEGKDSYYSERARYRERRQHRIDAPSLLETAVIAGNVVNTTTHALAKPIALFEEFESYIRQEFSSTIENEQKEDEMKVIEEEGTEFLQSFQENRSNNSASLSSIQNTDESSFQCGEKPTKFNIFVECTSNRDGVEDYNDDESKPSAISKSSASELFSNNQKNLKHCNTTLQNVIKLSKRKRTKRKPVRMKFSFLTSGKLKKEENFKAKTNILHDQSWLMDIKSEYDDSLDDESKSL